MKKTIREIDKKQGIIQVTTQDERWYSRKVKDAKTGLPVYTWVPSSTWISSYYPKGVGFMKWITKMGYDEAEAIKTAAGEKGTRVHELTELLDKGEKIPVDATFPNPTTGIQEELKEEEMDCLLSFSQWVDDTKPELLANEMTIFGKFKSSFGIQEYAGTLDRIYRIKDTIWIVDIKTSKSIQEPHKLQLGSYSHADIDYKKLKITEEEWKSRRLAVLQLGYDKYRTPGKGRYKFTEIEDKFYLFAGAAYQIWKNENPNTKPKQRDYPLIIQSEYRTKK